MNESCELFDRPEQLRNLLGAFDVVPLSEQILSDIDFLALYKQLEATAPIALLESGDQSGSSYLAWGEIEQPFASVTVTV